MKELSRHLLAAAVLAVIPITQASAQVTFGYIVSGAGPFTTVNDTLTVDNFGPANVILTPGVLSSARIGTLTYVHRDNRGVSSSATFDASRLVTLEGIPAILPQNAAMDVGTFSSGSVSGGGTAFFSLVGGGSVEMITIGHKTATIGIDGNVNDPIDAFFLYREAGTAPEPVSLSLFGLGLVGAVIARRRRTL